MLATLRIKNLAIVTDLTLELRPGCNVITGETGAGKSILIGALNLVLGQRADRTLIRTGADHCAVEATLEVAGLDWLGAFLEAHGLEPCEGGMLTLKRTLSAAGANRQFVNGSPTTLQTLAALGDRLVDIHGPHDHQSLLHPSHQLAILDAFGTLRPLRDAFAVLLQERQTKERERAALIVDERTYAQQLDMLRHQTHEVEGAHLQADEETALLESHARAGNAARLLEVAQEALGILDGREPSLLDQSGALGRALQVLQQLDAGAAPLILCQEQAAAQWRELHQELSRYADRVEIDPARFAELDARLSLIQSLKRKYGATLGEVIAFGVEARARLTALESRESELSRLKGELASIEVKLNEAGKALTARRKALIPRLSKAVERQLADLGFAQSHFAIGLERADATLTGADRVEFEFAPNPGEAARPLRAIASSGEMSRVMLALKTVLAAEDEIPVLVFDEVDANVGGETAHVVGAKLRQIGHKRQVLCITHLAPVAAAAHTHFVVNKRVKEGRTSAHIDALDEDARVEELTRMLGGQSAAARRHAKALLATPRG